MKISIKSQTVLKRGQKKAKPIISRPEKGQILFVALLFLCHIGTFKLQEYHEIFFEIWIKSCWPCIEAHYWRSSDFSWFVRLHTLGTMVPQFAYWSINSFLHPYESHLPFTPVVTTTTMIRALPRCHCRIYIAETQTGLQALSLLGAYNTRNEFFASSLETCALCKHFQWLRKKCILTVSITHRAQQKIMFLRILPRVDVCDIYLKSRSYCIIK